MYNEVDDGSADVSKSSKKGLLRRQQEQNTKKTPLKLYFNVLWKLVTVMHGVRENHENKCLGKLFREQKKRMV